MLKLSNFEIYAMNIFVILKKKALRNSNALCQMVKCSVIVSEGKKCGVSL